MRNLNVAILMSTFNGGKYIREQVTSLLTQSCRNIKIYIRDDGSTDRTLDILAEFVDERIELTSDRLGRLGPGGSFLHLLSKVRADIYMFCDQDDYWLPGKVQQAVSALEKAGITEPLLFHADPTLVDSNLKSMAASFNVYQGIRLPSDYEFSRMLVQNCVVGCTVALTDALVEKAQIRSPKFKSGNVAMHDWWVALCALSFGRVLFSLDESILYRQHIDNASGISTRRSFSERLQMLADFDAVNRVARYKRRIGRQAKYFLEMYEDLLSPQQIKILRGVRKLNDGYGIRGAIFCVSNGVVSKKLSMNLAFLYVTLLSVVYRNKGLQGGN